MDKYWTKNGQKKDQNWSKNRPKNGPKIDKKWTSMPSNKGDIFGQFL